MATQIREQARSDCPAWGAEAIRLEANPANPVYASESFLELKKIAVLDFDSNEYPFSRIFREALLASDSQSNANCKKEKREQRFAVMQEFRQRLSELPLGRIHVAVDPNCYDGAAGSLRLPAKSASPNLKLPKGNISRFLMRRLRNSYTKFITQIVAPHIATAMEPLECSSVFFQTSPCLRMCCPSTVAATHPHCDAMYYHQPGQINFWLPLTDAYGNNSLWVESAPFSFNHKPLELRCGQVARFYGNRCLHYTLPNDTPHTRITLDFRVVPGILFEKDYELSRDKDGIQMFSHGGYYSECKYDPVKREWVVQQYSPEKAAPAQSSMKPSEDNGQVEQHIQTDEQGRGHDVEGRDSAEAMAVKKGGRPFSMSSACTCDACLLVSRWVPDKEPLPVGNASTDVQNMDIEGH